MGRDQHIVDDVRGMERICKDLAEESRVPGEAAALRELAGNYGREAAKRTVASVVTLTLVSPERLFREFRWRILSR